MKFINYLESIAGVGIFPLLSLLIFFGFFAVLFLYVFKVDKHKMTCNKNIPLNDEI